VDNPFKPRPLVDVNVVSEFGAFHEAEGTTEAESLENRDYTYVPGFSNMRKTRDLDLARLHRGEIKGKEVSTLPVNMRWFRTVKGSGSDPDQMRMAAARNNKYRAVTKADLDAKHPWLTELPPGAQIAPDGTIKSAAGDLALYVTDRENAARIAIRRKKNIDESVSAVEMQIGGLGQVGSQHKGANPTVDTKIGGTK
jgi:hypothetical protein